MGKSCENCLHKEVCKYKDKATAKEVEEPFEISCKFYQGAVWLNPYYGGTALLSQTPKVMSICKGCMYHKDGVCKVPNGTVGLPCQTVTCSANDNQIN